MSSNVYYVHTFCPHYNVCYLCPDATIRPKTPCERARDAATHGPIGAYIPTCDAAGQYTPKQCWGSAGEHGRTYTLNSPIQLNVTLQCVSVICLLFMEHVYFW